MAIFLFNNEKIPVTAILDQGGNQLFSTLGIMSVSAVSAKQYATHTLEDGSIEADHSYDLQDRLNLSVIFDRDDYIAAYKEMKSLFRASTKFTIQTRVETYSDMYIESIPHEETPGMADTISMNISFIEQMFTKVEITTLPESKVSNPANSDSQPRGDNTGEVQDGTLLQRVLGGFL